MINFHLKRFFFFLRLLFLISSRLLTYVLMSKSSRFSRTSFLVLFLKISKIQWWFHFIALRRLTCPIVWIDIALFTILLLISTNVFCSAKTKQNKQINKEWLRFSFSFSRWELLLGFDFRLLNRLLKCEKWIDFHRRWLLFIFHGFS